MVGSRIFAGGMVAASVLAAGSLALAQGGAGAAASVGAKAYADNCAACHGANLEGGTFGALAGEAFLAKWGGRNAGELIAFAKKSMPPTDPGGLSDAEYAEIAQFILAKNGVAAVGSLAGAEPAKLASLVLPLKPPAGAGSPFSGSGVGGVTTRHPVPPAPARPQRFAGYTPVTEAMLANPAPENWLTWRRSHYGLGYSPLTDITKGNVGNLRLAWSVALPAGPNMNEPLVRDGVLYIHGFGDEIFALDAGDGKILWRYRRELPEGTGPASKKTIGLWGDKLYSATSDMHMIALDARTGRLVWDSVITDNPAFRNPGGPLVADGVVMQGLTGGGGGGGMIAGFDAETGARLWSFNTVAHPDEPGGDTWNGLPVEERSGGSSWTSGTYDPETGVALWGTGPTYDTGPMRDRKPGMNNDALYTDTTLAFEPRTGKLRWYYQHMKNDQFDLDWVFDRVIGKLEVKGEKRRVVMTSGKEGLFDVLDATDGSYIKTVDMGIQNFVTAIDPVTGEKTVNPDLIPSRDKTVFVCPHGGGGRNWGGTSFVEETQLLYVVGRDVCMDMIPARGRGFLTTGVNIDYAPPPDSDGNYAVLQALDMKAGKVKWEVRQRAPYDTGVLTTAGGVLFVGSVDRQVMALDQESGKELWRAGLSGVPNASPISFAADGKQYVAFVTGHGNPLSVGVQGMTPEIDFPPVSTSTLYVFALPE
jgi:alcohol dehydrogenase (cytochrome c)